MMLLVALLYVTLSIEENNLPLPISFSSDAKECFATAINGTAIYGTCIIYFSNMEANISDINCASYLGKTVIKFIKAKEQPFTVPLRSISNVSAIYFTTWSGCKGNCEFCIVPYDLGSYIMIDVVTSQREETRQLNVLTVENYNYRHCFFNDQMMQVSHIGDLILFIAYLSPTHKCSMIPSVHINSLTVVIGYLDDKGELNQLVELLLKPHATILKESTFFFFCKDDCLSHYHNILRTTFVFMNMHFNVSFGDQIAILTNKIFDLSTIRYNSCFNSINVILSKTAISIYITQRPSVACPLQKTYDNIPINSVSPELVLSSFCNTVKPARYSSIHALNLIDTRGAIVYKCPDCMSIIHHEGVAFNQIDFRNKTTLFSNLLLILHLANGSTDIIRYSINTLRVADWDTTSILVDAFTFRFKATNSVLRRQAPTSLDCTHVQISFCYNKEKFIGLFQHDINEKKMTFNIPLVKTNGSILASERCTHLFPSKHLRNSCGKILSLLKSQNYTLYYQFIASDRVCSDLQHVDYIVIDSLSRKTVIMYIVILLVFTLVLCVFFIFYIALEHYNNVLTIRNSSSF